MDTLNWAKQIGLTLHRLDEATLSCITPVFELNVLPVIGLEDKWIEELLLGVRVCVRQPKLSGFANPSLISVVPGDVLQLVSRRDSRHQLAHVWTCGNRIFAYQGRGVLLHILWALAVERSPYEAVALVLKRPLNLDEIELVSHATNQIINNVR